MNPNLKTDPWRYNAWLGYSAKPIFCLPTIKICKHCLDSQDAIRAAKKEGFQIRITVCQDCAEQFGHEPVLV